MENIDEYLRISICSILNSVSKETVKDIIQAVKYAGLESLSDLQFVREEDLILVLKPIQRRKLIKAWCEQNKGGEHLAKEENVDSSSKVKSVVPTPGFNMTTTISASGTSIGSEDTDSERSLKDFESNEVDDLKFFIKTMKEKKVVGAPSISAFRTTTTVPGVLADNSSAITSTTQSEISDEGKKFGDFDTKKNFTVRVDNLSKRATKSDVEDLFKHFGKISAIQMDKNKSGQHKGFAFITFSRRDDAIEALYKVNGHEYDNLTLKVKWIGFSET